MFDDEETETIDPNADPVLGPNDSEAFDEYLEAENDEEGDYYTDAFGDDFLEF